MPCLSPFSLSIIRGAVEIVLRPSNTYLLEARLALTLTLHDLSLINMHPIAIKHGCQLGFEPFRHGVAIPSDTSVDSNERKCRCSTGSLLFLPAVQSPTPNISTAAHQSRSSLATSEQPVHQATCMNSSRQLVRFTIRDTFTRANRLCDGGHVAERLQ